MKHCALTASNWSKAVGFVALNAALLFTTGCASTGKVEPIAQRLPRGSSCVALVSTSTKRQLTAGVPNLEHGPKVDGAVAIGLGPAKYIFDQLEYAGANEPYGPAVALAAAAAWIPPGALLGAAYGAATSVPDSEIQTAIQAASNFISHYDFDVELIRTMSAKAWMHHEIGLNSFTPTGAGQIFDSLSQRGFRYVIELSMGTVWLDGDYELRNPRVSLKVDLMARLYRLQGSRREEIHLIHIRYRGEKQRFVRWMAEDAKALRAEVDKCQRTVATQILEAFAE